MDPSLRSSVKRDFAVIKDLRVGQDGSPSRTVERLGELLAGSGIRAIFQLRLLDSASGKEKSVVNVAIDSKSSKPGTTAVEKADVEILTTPETWSEIASGQLPPILAFLTGRMRFRGDSGLAQEMHRHLAGGAGRTHLCGGK